METRIARVEKRWGRPAPPPALDGWNPAALSMREKLELDDLLALLEARDHPWRPGRPLTAEEAGRLEDLDARCRVGSGTE